MAHALTVARAFLRCALVATFMATPAAALTAPCEITESSASIMFADAEVTVENLARLRDFGRSDIGSDQMPAFEIAPDRRHAALLLRQADPERNRFCQALVIIPMSERAKPRMLPTDSAPVRQAFALRGTLTPNGQIAANRIRWSPDGRSIAFLAERLGRAQVRTIVLEEGGERFVSAAPSDVLDFAWLPGGDAIVYSTRAGMPAHDAAIAREARSGLHFDERSTPLMTVVPLPPSTLETSYHVVDVKTGAERLATIVEVAVLAPGRQPFHPPDVTAFASDETGRQAWIAPLHSGRWSTPLALVAQTANRSITCSEEACMGRLGGLWWSGGSIVYLRREGWGKSRTAVYRWRPGARPSRLFVTDDALVGCDIDGRRLVCGREGSLRPRHLWSLELATGRQQILFDPNPDFNRHRLPTVRRIYWRGMLNTEGYGDLVIPNSAPPANGFLLVVVQCRTRGLLRGAIGDEYPILPMTEKGFVVLSVENALDYASALNDPSIAGFDQAVRTGVVDDNERRLQFANLEAGLATAMDIVAVDPARLAITGVSDAASSAVYALMNSTRFAVAALGSPTLDASHIALGGPALQAEFVAHGYPAPGSPGEAEFYRHTALAPGPNTVKTPILWQVPQDEYLAGLTNFSAFRTARAPVELYVFPNEHHLKWQPAHRLAVYRRNLAWIDFWLQRREDAALATSREYDRWRGLRTQLCESEGGRSVTQLCSQASTSTNSVTR